MNEITEKAYSFNESVSLAEANGFKINPIQQMKSEESREQPYKTGPNDVTITTGKIEIVNEKYGIFSADRDKAVQTKTTTLLSPPFDAVDAISLLFTGGKKTDTIERNSITYQTSQKGDKVTNAIGTLFGVMSTITTGKHDYRTVKIYDNWNDYSKATGGTGRMLYYKNK